MVATDPQGFAAATSLLTQTVGDDVSSAAVSLSGHRSIAFVVCLYDNDASDGVLALQTAPTSTGAWTTRATKAIPAGTANYTIAARAGACPGQYARVNLTSGGDNFQVGGIVAVAMDPALVESASSFDVVLVDSS